MTHASVALRVPTTSAPPRVDLLAPSDLSAVDIGRWEDLALRALTPNPFFEPAFVLPAERHLRGRRIRLLVARDRSGRWIGAMPVRQSARWRQLPVPAVAAWHHEYSYLGAPLLARGSEAEGLVELLRAARRRAPVVALEQLPADEIGGPLREACEHLGADPVVWAETERAFLRRRADPGDYLLLRSKRLRELRRQRAALGRELGGDPVVCERAGEAAAVDRFLALESAGWKGDNGTAMSHAGADEFFRAICAGFADAGRLQLLALEAGGRTVAMKCNLIAGEAVFCFKIAHDPALARSSPGVQLELENVERFHERPELAWMDSCADPDNQMINRLWADRRNLCTIIVPCGGVVGRAARTDAVVASSIRRRLKEHLR
jgi:CelD/BcsL family acetyltransferase involved in cellulose biosynthesis